MALRLQELHPSLVHYPIALIPTALIADAVGCLTNDRGLMDMGRRLMPVAAASGILTGVAGLIAQEAAQPRGRAHDMLTTHRTLNMGLVALTGAMAISRSRRARPSAGYLLAGFAGMAAMLYSTYLGGRMVYEHGVGVKPAGGLRPGAAPQFRYGQFGEAARIAGGHVVQGVRHSAEHMAEGDFVPTLRH